MPEVLLCHLPPRAALPIIRQHCQASLSDSLPMFKALKAELWLSRQALRFSQRSYDLDYAALTKYSQVQHRWLSPQKVCCRPSVWLFVLRFTIRKLPTPAGGSFFSGHMGLFSPLAKHRFEEKNSMALGPIYRQRYYTRQTVVVADPALAQEVRAHLPQSAWRAHATPAEPNWVEASDTQQDTHLRLTYPTRLGIR